jgi:hypothetical protein
MCINKNYNILYKRLNTKILKKSLFYASEIVVKLIIAPLNNETKFNISRKLLYNGAGAIRIISARISI